MNDRARALRDEFDRSFAAPASGEREPSEDFLAVRVAGTPCALRTSDVRHVSSAARIVPFPSLRPELLGIARMRGAAVPVFSAARLLGLAEGDTAPRWLAACGAAGELAIAFEAFDAFLRVPRTAVSARAPGAPSPRHTRELVRDASSTRAVIDLASVIQAVSTT